MNGSVGMKEEQHCIDETGEGSTIQSWFTVETAVDHHNETLGTDRRRHHYASRSAWDEEKSGIRVD